MPLRLALSAAVLLLSLPALGQTNDPVFRSWRWEDRSTLSPRAAGMGGAFVAVANDFGAALLNPAGVAACPKALEGAWNGVVPNNASFGEERVRRDEWAAGILARVGCRFGMALYFEKPASLRIDEDPGSPYRGSFEAGVSGPGAAVAYRVHHRLEVGAGVRFLELDSAGVSSPRASPTTTPVTFTDGHNKWDTAWTAGLLFNLHPRTHAGLAYRSGVKWPLLRDPPAQVAGSSFSKPALRMPAVLSAGAAWEVRIAHHRAWMILTAQADLVRYSEVESGLLAARQQFSASDYRLSDAWDLRAGVEMSVPTQCWTGCGTMFQFRLGVHRQQSPILSYEGANPAEATLFPGEPTRWVGSAGGSFALKLVLPIRLDFAARFGKGVSTTVIFGVALRYGRTFGDAGPR
jgi:opacity protein-like surface antigen